MRYIPTRYLAIVAVLALAACAGTPQTRATTSLAIACDSIGTSLKQLAVYRADGKLSDKQVTTVTGIRDATEPFCDPSSKVDPAEVVGFVQASAAQLKTIFGSN